MKEFVYLKPELKKGNLVAIDLATGKESSHLVRDHMLQLAKENAHTQEILVKNLMDQQKSAEISMDKNHIKIGGNGMKIATSNDKDLVWGNDKPPKKGRK